MNTLTKCPNCNERLQRFADGLVICPVCWHTYIKESSNKTTAILETRTGVMAPAKCRVEITLKEYYETDY